MSTTNQMLHSEIASHSIEYRVVYSLVFTVCLAVALLFCVLPRAWNPFVADTGARTSLLRQARSATESTVPYVFQV